MSVLTLAAPDKGVIEIYTIQIGQHRLLKNTDIKFLDVTAKSGWKAFAPDFGDVMKYKRGEMDEQEYTRIYKRRMELSRMANVSLWNNLKKAKKMAIACYCKAGVFCHRHLLKEDFKTYLELAGFEVKLMGEYTRENKERENGSTEGTDDFPF